jgi:hypothetical protein
LNQVQAVMGATLFYSAVVVTVGAVLILWRSLTGVQRRAYALLLIAALGLIPVAAAIELRYRDVFVLPYALFITWAVSSALLANRFVGRAGPALVVVAALIFTTPRFAANVRESEFLRLGDSRVAASRWLEANVRTPSSLAKEYTIGDFLTHANGYQGGQLSWSSVGSILEQTPQQWWEQGVMYLVADSRTTTNSWFDSATPRSKFGGLTLAYQTPSDYPGPGSHIAIFYTFAIRTPTNVRFGDVAQLYGYNLDQRQACPGAQVGMRMFLRALGATDLYYEMEIVLRDAAGAAVITQRQAPALGQRPTTVWEARELIFDDHWLELPPDLAPGVYTLELAVYEPFHQERVRVYTPDLVLVGESVALGQLAVTRAAC